MNYPGKALAVINLKSSFFVSHIFALISGSQRTFDGLGIERLYIDWADEKSINSTVIYQTFAVANF